MRVSPGVAGPEHLSAQQNQDGAQPLAAAGLQVLADRGERFHRGDGLEADLALHLVQVLADQVENLDGGERLADFAECHGNV